METEKTNYRELARRVGDIILCNNITQIDENLFDRIENGSFEYCPIHENVEECNDNCEHECKEIYQYYLITDSGADYLKRNTEEIILYSEKLELYVWGITHFGTPWEGVDVVLQEKNNK